MRDPSTTHGRAITSFYVARRQCVNNTGSCPTFVHHLVMNQTLSYMKNWALACSGFSTSFSVIVEFSSLCVGTFGHLSLTSLLISKEHAYRVTAWVYACVCQRPKLPADKQIFYQIVEQYFILAIKNSYIFRPHILAICRELQVRSVCSAYSWRTIGAPKQGIVRSILNRKRNVPSTTDIWIRSLTFINY
jgi:hypothetical protein